MQYTIPIESQMEMFARVYSKNSGIEIAFGPTFCTDGKKIYVVPISDQANRWQRFKSEMLVYHETGHIKYSDMTLLPKDKVLRSIHNSIEDAWIEHKMETEWKGMARKWPEFLTKFVQDKNTAINRRLPPIEWLQQLLYLKARERHLGLKLNINPPASVQEIFEKRLAQYVPAIAECKSTKEAIKIAQDVYNALKNLIDEQKKQDKQKGQDNSQKNTGSYKNGSEGHEGQVSPSSGNGKDDRGKDQGDSAKSSRGKLGGANKVLREIEQQIKDGDVQDTGIGRQLQDTLNKYVENTHIVRNDFGLKENVIRPTPEVGRAWQSQVKQFEDHGREMTGYCGTKLRSLFISERVPRWTNNLESGKLNTRQLYRIKSGGAKNIFRRRTVRVYEDSAVSMVIDHSDSMNSISMDAHGLLVALANELDRLRVPFEVIGFTTDEDQAMSDYIRRVPATLHVLKTFEEPYRKVLRNFAWPRGTNMTNELPAIELAAKHLAMRRETKKILFVISDGETCFSPVDDAVRYTMKLFVERLTRAGVKVVGFGIGTNNISYYCPDWVEVTDISLFTSEFYGKLMEYLL